MDINTMSLQLRILPELRPADQAVHNHLPDIVDCPLVVPFLLQCLEVIMAESASKPIAEFFSMSAFDMLIQHRFKIEDLVTETALDWGMFVMVFHVLSNHLLRVEFPLTKVTLKVSGAMYFFMFGEVG